MRTRRARRIVVSAILAVAPLGAFAQEPPRPPRDGAGRVDLKPRYAADELLDVEGRFTLELGISMTVPQRAIARTTTQVQASGFRYRDRVLEVGPDGAPRRVRRRYAEAWTAEQDPGAREPTRVPAPLDRAALELWRDERGNVAAKRLEGSPVLEEGATAFERLGERWEGALPPGGTAERGATWKVKGEALAALFGAALGAKPEGELSGRLEAVREEPLEPGAAPETVAIVAVAVNARRTEEEELKLEAQLSGALKFALKRGKIVAVELKGQGIVDQERKDPKDPTGDTMVIKGRGPLAIVKRVRFPKNGERPDGK